MNDTLKHFQEGKIIAFFAAAKIIADIQNAAKMKKSEFKMPTKRVAILNFLSYQPNGTSYNNAIAYELGEKQVSNDYTELENLGYISRETPKEDRRKTKVSITKKGLAFLEKYAKFVNDAIQEIAERQTIDELEFDSLPN